MGAFVQVGKLYVPGDGTNAVTLIEPPQTESYLVSLLRVMFLMSTNKADGSPRLLSLNVAALGQDTITVVRIPLFVAEAETTVDLIPYLSNTGNFGLSNPDRITVDVDEAVDASDVLKFQGFSIVGGDA